MPGLDAADPSGGTVVVRASGRQAQTFSDCVLQPPAAGWGNPAIQTLSSADHGSLVGWSEACGSDFQSRAQVARLGVPTF